MSSETLTEGQAPFTAGHFYVLLSMVGATVAVVVARHTHPAALLLISAAVMASGYTAYALHRALAGLWSGAATEEPLGVRHREILLQEKALVLRAIKDLEFDFGMKKMSATDYADMLERLRARALTLMQQLEQSPDLSTVASADVAVQPATAPRADKERRPREHTCVRCGTRNEPDAKFCKQCGDRLGSANA
ncbi:MAG TPA: zinc ribbon domain-containing protein [Vicinamibacterales bacterium]|nr:zinc ribbon domain-containing protein [Vicinamibacterales bacterium]